MTVLNDKSRWEGGHLATFASWSKAKKERYDVTANFYSKNAPYFHQRFGNHLEREVRNQLDEMSGRVLVLGCGSGKEVSYLAEQGCDVNGIDFSDEAIFLARNLYPKLWNRFHVEDMYNVDNFGDGKYNGIVANAVFVHLLERSDLEIMMERIARRLAPKGLCYVRLLEKEDCLEEYDRNLFDRTRWFIYYTMDDLVTAGGRAGLKVVGRDRMPHAQYKNVFWVSTLSSKV